MSKNRVALAISFCLIAVLAGFSAWLYVGAEGLESKVGDLESRVDDLKSRRHDLESRVSEQLVIVPTYSFGEPQSISFGIIHTGTAEVTISEIRVNDVLNSSSPGWVGDETLIPGQMGEITLYGLKYLADGFKEGRSYQFRFITAGGNSFYCAVWYGGRPSPTPSPTSPRTEMLKIAGVTWSDNNAIFMAMNTGTADLTIVEVRVNGEHATMSPSPVTLNPGDQTTITVTRTGGFTSGVKYEFAFFTASGMQFRYVWSF